MSFDLNPIATAAEDEQNYRKVCFNLVDYIEAIVDPSLEEMMKDYVHKNVKLVRNHYQSLVACAREKVIHATKSVSIMKERVDDHHTKACNSKIELNDKLKELDRVGEKQTNEMRDLKVRHKDMDEALEKKIRNLQEEHKKRKEEELKSVISSQGINLFDLEDDIESIQNDVTIYEKQREFKIS